MASEKTMTVGSLDLETRRPSGPVDSDDPYVIHRTATPHGANDAGYVSLVVVCGRRHARIAGIVVRRYSRSNVDPVRPLIAVEGNCAESAYVWRYAERVISRGRPHVSGQIRMAGIDAGADDSDSGVLG